METSLITYSALRKFTNCRKAFKYRYIDQIVPKKKSEVLVFGSIIHDCLEEWYTNENKRAVKRLIGELCSESDRSNMKLEALAMMYGYIKKYPSEEFKVIKLEESFSGSIINPETSLKSKKLSMGGKIDGLVECNGKYYILEHKTSSVITRGYMERLPTDFQILLYSIYANDLYPDKPVSGIIYNILVKARLRKEAWKISKRDYYLRLCDKHSQAAMFQRKKISINPVYVKKLKKNVWELSQAIIRACKKNFFYSNSSHCFKWNRPCDYYKLCYSNNKNQNAKLLDTFYEHREIHSELGELKQKYKPLSNLIES